MVNSVPFNPVILDQDTTSDRSIVNLLPAVHRTDTINRFIGSSIDNLFVPGSGRQINGYIGQQPSYYDQSQDFYLSEPNNSRQFYQLESAMVSKDPSGKVTNLLSYPDIINQLRFQGAFVNNHNRLFEQDYYSWCPPVDLDKLINFRFYFWVEQNDLSPDYLVIKRGSTNGNPWSTNNLWYHQDDLTDVQKSGSIFQATRPIIEFQKDLELYDYGSWRREAVYACASGLDLNSLVLAANSTLIPTLLIDGSAVSTATGKVRILVLNDIDSQLNNQIYSINFDNSGQISLSLETDGLDPSGTATTGEILLVKTGVEFNNTELYFDGSSWKIGQQKSDVNISPLFNLYDVNNTSLSDSTTYPQSDFAGSKIFTYHYDTTGTSLPDPVLNIPLTFDSNGQINFENYLSTTRYHYFQNNASLEISGFYFHKSTNDLTEIFENDWYQVDKPSRQMMVDQYICDGANNIFAVSQIPDLDIADQEANLQVYRTSQSKSATSDTTFHLLVERIDYLRFDGGIILASSSAGDVIKIRSFSKSGPSDTSGGFYEVPINLQANPNNEQVAIISTGDFALQFSDIMQNQTGFSGKPYSNNNWRNLTPDLSKGHHIIQNGANLLNLCLTLQSNNLDYMNSVRYCEIEYTRFRNKFEQQITNFFQNGKSQTDGSIKWQDAWINDALKVINKGKTQTFPFAYSGKAEKIGNTTIYNNIGSTPNYQVPTFIPPTPSFLGVYPLYTPSLRVDYTYEITYNNSDNSSIPKVVIQNHDGSLTPSYGTYKLDDLGNITPYNGIVDPRDAVLLQLEQRIFASVNPAIIARDRPAFDWQHYYSTYSRPGDYTSQEYLLLLQPDFDRWITQYGLDFRTNSTFNASDPFTWNWSQISGIDGNLLPGHWRGIYQYYYDTDEPHIAPWKMLGFTTKPNYWDGLYGPAPYTSNNLTMWRDLEIGFIAQGERQGLNETWSRTNLSQYIPVDEEGNLLDPGQAGVAKAYPSANFASMPWKFGDCGPVETAWRRSPLFGFAVAQAGYLMKPARFFGTLWNSTDFVVKNRQTIDASTNDRPLHSELSVHGEKDSSGNVIVNIGIQQWISNYLINLNQNITTALGEPIRGLDVRLAYKMASYTDSSSLSVSSDAFGIVPAEDVSVALYQSPSVREEFYSGVVVNYDGEAFNIFGYDILNPSFNIIQPNTTGPGHPVTFGTVRQVNIPNWTPGNSYSAGVTVNHSGLYYACIRSHTASVVFEIDFWQQVVKPNFTSDLTVIWYESVVTNSVTNIPYGTRLPTLQDVATFLCGLQNYYVSRGWVFSIVVNNSYTSDWSRSCYEFLAWFNDNQAIPGSFIILSPGSSGIEFNTAQGEAQSVEQYINGTYSLIDRLAKPINPNTVDIARLDGQLIITPTSTVNGGIFGCRVYVSELEHVIIFDNTTIFNDTIYNPLLNIRQPRLRLQGFKTTNWKGRFNAPGFVVNGATLSPNFEKTVDDLRRLFDVETVDDGSLQQRARNNVGYSERDYLSALLMTPTNQFEFYQGMIQQKGTPTVMNRLLRSNFIRNNENIKFLEEWLFRVGDYGSAEINPSFDLQLKRSEVTTDPQLITFNVDASVTSQTNNVIEITDITGTNKKRDPRWIWQQDTSQISWQTKQFPNHTKGFLPGAGYVNVNNVSWTALNRSGLVDLYYSTLLSKPSTVISNSYTFTYDGISNTAANFRIAIVPNLNEGYLRINTVTFNVTDCFVANSMAVNVGRINSPFEFARATPEALTLGGQFSFQPSAFFELNHESDNTIYIEFLYSNLIQAIDANIGKVTITVSAEQFVDSVLPNHRVLVYTDIMGDWNTYKLQDTNSTIENAYIPSFAGQGSPISTKQLDPSISSSDLLLLDGVNNSSGTGDQYVFDSVYNPVFSNTIRLIVNSSLISTAQVNTLGYSIIPVFQMLSSAGMVIDSLTFNVIEPFIGGTASPKIQVGVSDVNNYFVKIFTPLNEFVANNPQVTIAPSFAINDPIAVDIYDTTISVSESDTFVPVQVIRSGNIYNSLTSITVTNPGSGYVTPPKVSVSGPQGVQALASLAGGVKQILITNGGSGYTSTPIVTITGGNGLGAQAHAILTAGVVTSISVTSTGAGYTTEPSVLITDGGGLGATAQSTVDYGVASVSVLSTGGCLYDGTVTPVVSFYGGGGSGATAITSFNTPLGPMKLNWRYYQNSPDVSGWTEGGSVTFVPVGTPVSGQADPSTAYWLQTIYVPIATPENDNSIYQVQIYNPDSTDLSYAITQDIATITVVKTEVGNNSVDLSVIGTTVISGDTVPIDGYLNAYLLANSNTGIVILSVDYHYTEGFEVFNLDKTPKIITAPGSGGRILGWYPTRFANLSARDTAVMPGGWQPHDIIEVDYVASVLGSGGWSTYEHYDIWANVRLGLQNVNALLAQIESYLPTSDGNLNASVHSAIETLDIDTVSAELAALIPEQPIVWNQLDSETLKVDSSQFVNATIYNQLTDNVITTLQLFDPYQGYIVGTADRELTYKVSYDPAIYNTSSDPSIQVAGQYCWGINQTNQLWWDLSTVRYIDYQISDTSYRWKHWGKLAPGATIDIYQWVRSPVPPSNWAIFILNATSYPGFETTPTSGMVRDPSVVGWVQQQEWITQLNREATVYYFWVKDITNVPQNCGRNLSALQVENIITNPSSEDIAWFAAVDSNKLIVGGIQQFLNDQDTVLNVKWKTNTNEGNHHKQWKIIRENDITTEIDVSILWNKMRDSLVGWDDYASTVTNSTKLAANFAINDQILVVVDDSNLAQSGEINLNGSIITYRYKYNNHLKGLTNTSQVSGVTNDSVVQAITGPTPQIVPDPYLTPKETLGNMIRPRQSWFMPDQNGAPSRYARQIFVKSFNTLMQAQPYLDVWYQWETIFNVGEDLPSANEYATEAASFDIRDQLAIAGGISLGQVVLIPGIPATSNFWTLWRYESNDLISGLPVFSLIRAQRYHFNEGYLWNRVDWYAEGWSVADFPLYHFPSRAAFNAAPQISDTLLKGTLVMIDQESDSDPRWSWLLLQNGKPIEVAKQAGTLALSSAFYDPSKILYGFDNFVISDITNRDGSWELKTLLDNIPVTVFSQIQLNELFFSMARCALSMNNDIDWIIKSSFMTVGGYSQELKQNPLAYPDQINSIISYIQEVKPYHVTIRNYLLQYTVGPDAVNTHLTDFDAGYGNRQFSGSVAATSEFAATVASAQNVAQSQTVAQSVAVEAGLVQHKSAVPQDITPFVEVVNSDPQLWNGLRHIKTTILFDRVDCSDEDISGWDLMPWDYANDRFVTNGVPGSQRQQLIGSYNISEVNSNEYIIFNDNYSSGNPSLWDLSSNLHAASRIAQFYAPTPGMPTSNLISGCGYKGYVFDGGPSSYGLWSEFGWSFEGGWANEAAYYDGQADSTSSVNTHPQTQPPGDETPLTTDYMVGDLIVDGRGLVISDSQAVSEQFDIDSGSFFDPNQGGHPEELVPLRLIGSLAITLKRNDGTGNITTSAFSITHVQ